VALQGNGQKMPHLGVHVSYSLKAFLIVFIFTQLHLEKWR
jgi:hypothetical protein